MEGVESHCRLLPRGLHHSSPSSPVLLPLGKVPGEAQSSYTHASLVVWLATLLRLKHQEYHLSWLLSTSCYEEETQ